MAFQKLQTFDLQEKPLPSHFDKVENRLWVTTKFEPPLNLTLYNLRSYILAKIDNLLIYYTN